jgi:hypothetical protein
MILQRSTIAVLGLLAIVVLGEVHAAVVYDLSLDGIARDAGAAALLIMCGLAAIALAKNSLSAVRWDVVSFVSV